MTGPPPLRSTQPVGAKGLIIACRLLSNETHPGATIGMTSEKRWFDDVRHKRMSPVGAFARVELG